MHKSPIFGRRERRLGAAAAAMAALALASSVQAQAVERPAAPAVQPAGTDLSGVLVISNQSKAIPQDASLQPLPAWPLTPAAAAERKAAKPENDPSARCMPMMPRIMSFPYPIQIVQAPGLVVILFEAERVFRLIYTDGRPHNEDATPWLGSSIGHWEGDTLVVETRNVNSEAWFDQSGIPISDKLVITERIRKIDGGQRLEDVVKVEDPEVFTTPVFQRYVYNYKSDWQLLEYLCNEGNRDDVTSTSAGGAGSFNIPKQ